MTLDKEIQKKITEEWLTAFPQLSAFSQNKLYKIVGCCLIGIELIKLPHSKEYRPHFVLYPLWKSDVKKCLEAPSVMIQIYNNKGLLFNIPYSTHSNYFPEAVKCFKHQILIPLNGDVKVKLLLALVDNQFGDMLIKSHSGKQAQLFEFKFYVALYTGNLLQVQNILEQIQKEYKTWNMQMFEMWYGKFDIWMYNLEKLVLNRDEFLKQIEINKQDKKIVELNSSELG